MKSRVVLLGPPGAGKGTVAGHLQKVFGLAHISSGHLLRREVEMGTSVGRQIQLFLDKGELAPDDIVVSYMHHRLTPEMLGGGFVLDGFPRTARQGVALDEHLGRLGCPVQLVLYCYCPEELILKRVTGRRMCPKCGSVYNLSNTPPQVSGVCDQCGQMIVQRVDDSELVVRQRLRIYSELTEPLIAFYREQGKLITLDMSRSAAEANRVSAEAVKQ